MEKEDALWNLTSKIISRLHFQTEGAVLFIPPQPFPLAKTVWVHGIRYIDGVIAGNYPPVDSPVFLFNATTRHSMSVNAYLLPNFYQRPVTVRDGSHGYVIGRLGRRNEGDGTYHPSDGVLR
jgi:hypothetical protein